MREPLAIGGTLVPPGERAVIRIPIARPFGQVDVFVPAHVVHGRRPGPRLFVSAAIHGDEINGVEIIRRLLRLRALRSLRGSLVAVPIVNVYGFQLRSRYLPDRRDLNRSFPGSPSGSLTSRLAHRFMVEVVAKSNYGIDLHTGAANRANLPQIRASLDDSETQRLARAFGAPVILDANLRDGSLRQAVLERNIPMLLYEAGEALRFDELAIRAGVRGIASVMRAIGMLPPRASARAPIEPFVARSSGWVRAPESGVLRSAVRLGARAERGQRLGVISSPLGEGEVAVTAPRSGLVIGETKIPLVNEGDALFHVAVFDEPETVAGQVEAFQGQLGPVDFDG